MRSCLTVLFASLALFAGGARAQSPPSIPLAVSTKCAGCHPVPRPTSMARHAWPRVFDTMLMLMKEASVPLLQSEFEEIESFYLRNSPVALEQIPDDYEDSHLEFATSSIGKYIPEERPQVTGAYITDLDGDGIANELVVTDNGLGEVNWLRQVDGSWDETTLAEVPAPVDAKPFDFDGDGDIDLAVSAMGEMHPNDDLIGEFHLLLNDGSGTFEQKVLARGTPRISESAPADYDGDGDIDFVLAMFGWRSTGGIGYLEQQEDGSFVLRTILDLNGVMRVLVNDANGDDLPDFVVLATQQHESIFQFFNRGGGNFEGSYITRANHPAFGSSSIHLEDLDQDGDEDILYTNGDMMDENAEAKPYHGLRWLENDGSGGYSLHYLAGMPGCYDAEPADMDGDGDLDVVFSSLNFLWQEHDFPSLAWLENRGGFRDLVPRRIAYAPTNLAKIAVGDVNGDGKPDIVGCGMHVPGPLDRKGRITLWLAK